ncbi:MAG: hypothetical protein Pg6C_12330 [Treponemataceae bacterium]|nr:MAG: hypothetical protein Pg6C_12330 [Treponemataceae bacterium]
MIRARPAEEIDSQILASPALLFLYYRVEKILGIKALPDMLIKLNNFLEEKCGAKFVENPSEYERALSSRDNLFEIAGLLTINETYFFREGAHFNLLLNNFLPRLAELGRPVRVCSAACSIGCEAYSIAMLFDFFSKKNQPLEYEIDAFDISASAITAAKNARFTSNTLRTDGAEWKYILDSRLIPDHDEFIVPREIKEKVRFFTHNIMDSLDSQYDVVFFRNALIYFTPENRLSVMNRLAELLCHDGILFLGISETSAAYHPLLTNRYSENVFYFQKILPPVDCKPSRKNVAADGHQKIMPSAAAEHADRRDAAKPAPSQKFVIDCQETASILENMDGDANARKALGILSGGSQDTAPESLSGAQLAACAAIFLSEQDFPSANSALAFLEQSNSSAVTLFLRGEYNFLTGNAAEAEKKFEEAAEKDSAFWPAFYRLSSLAAQGNRTRYKYKLKKARESLELGKDKRYECFLGGFSPDYFRRILEKKLS